MKNNGISAGNIMLLTFVLGAFFVWIAESFLEFLWFNHALSSFLEILFPLYRPHEMLMRIILVSSLLVSGGIVSHLYGKLALSEKKSRESENDLRITFKSIGDAVVATNADGRITRMNPVAERLTGWSVKDAIGVSLPEIFKIINAQTREGCESPVDKVLRTRKTVGLSNHTVLISRSGEEFQISDSASPIITEDGDIAGVVLVFRDVTEEYSREKELNRLRNYLSNIIDSMPSIIVGVDPHGRVTQWNMSAQEDTGITTNDAIGQNLSDVFPRMVMEMDKVRESVRTRKAQYELRKPRKCEDGLCYEDITIFPLIANGVEGAVIQVDDVTEQFNLEQMMIQTEKMMSVGGLAAGMAHEINNPLAAIAGNTQNIKNRIYKDLRQNTETASECDISLERMRNYLSKRDIPRMLEGIAESCNRAAKIVSNMLRFSRKSDKRFSECDLAKLMDNTIELAANDYDLKKEYDFRKIGIVKEYSDELPSVYCEENEIQQVLLNLLKNGAQAMNEKEYDEGGPCFILRLKRDDDMACIEVEDNGPGIPEDIRNRVFEPFYSTKGVGHGTGLGLSVSYFIIADQHNGIMDVDSVPGSWTRFGVRIPISC
ncbi:PAS domain-containing sensor histidine kinase [Maridesulfovibrio zosterae]|uniref:PAS domain-containing sensor histidine kinase n=1 Tax=Maridesulfovibrio zosterae TaxID=82171 RepID=UPI0004273FC2|nr:PAS domain S-box protein [Maridesulfovibrio zosterae]